MVINKPAGWVVHEGAGEVGETIVDWFVKNNPAVTHHTWPDPVRIGIIHRLDKDTSGVMALAKDPDSLQQMQHQFQERTTEKVYRAIVYGTPKEPVGQLTTYIGRHPKRRQEQAVLPIPVGEQKRREAITDYALEDTYMLMQEYISLLRFQPKTGRMHQLRVHAKYLGCPILGDTTYTIKPAKRLSKACNISRQLLHAVSLTFNHPHTNERMHCTAPLPSDMKEVLDRAKPC